MSDTKHILVVDDDAQVCRLLERFLSLEGFKVTAAPNGTAMRRALEGRNVDLVILDLMLPGEDGLTLAREIRSTSSLPVIMLTGKQDTVDKVVGLELGADDYMTKPFDQRELLARIRSVLRRAQAAPEVAPPQGTNNGQKAAMFRNWRVDFGRRDVTSPQGASVHFTTHEFNLLAFLVTHQGRVVTRDQILDQVCDRMAEPFDRSVDVLVGKVRRKLDDDPRTPSLIKTIRGIGYMFVEPVSFE